MAQIFLIILIFSSTLAYADSYKFRIRLREHFETHHISSNAVNTTYKGLNNTMNLWWESPYNLSYGFSLSPIISGLKNNDPSAVFGKKVQLINLGFELKYFFIKSLKPIFIRPGLGYSELQKSIGPTTSGHFIYLGLGYEHAFEKFSIALEWAYRQARLGEGLTVNTTTPSIGFHFYGYL